MANAFYCGMAYPGRSIRGGPVAELRSRSDLAGGVTGTAGGRGGSRNFPMEYCLQQFQLSRQIGQRHMPPSCHQ